MQHKARHLYLLLFILIIGGYCWLGVNLFNLFPQSKILICPFKALTNLPCPSCGSTRSILYALKGNLINSILTNPFGVVLLVALIILPIWLSADLIFRKETFYMFYIKVENKLKNKFWIIIAISVVIANWCWNIYKNL